jgi:hypothetical protein
MLEFSKTSAGQVQQHPHARKAGTAALMADAGTTITSGLITAWTHAVLAARLRCFTTMLAANAMSHPVLSRAALAHHAPLATLLELFMELPSPRYAV